jgi:N-acetyl-gamma-glutamyl-phosphate reductase
MKARVGILGASGYMGGEALRVVLEHPELELAWATSRSPGPVEAHHPNLHGLGLELVSPEATTPCDVVLLAVPTEAAIAEARRFLLEGARVVDLGAAFRLRDRATWERVYGCRHTDWALAEEAVYGVPELHGAAVREARLVANPGCFSSAAILALAPLVEAGWVELERLVVDGLSGTTGVGAELTRAAHHPEVASNLVAYNAVGHRHTFEIEQELSALADAPVRVHFTPVYVPIVRGILDVCHAFPRKPVRREEVLDLLRSFYAGEPFVHVWDAPAPRDATWRYEPYPWVSAVAGTNHCLLGADVDMERGRIVLFSALDSIGKGGAQVGIENVNLMLGLPRETGLGRRGLHPH